MSRWIHSIKRVSARWKSRSPTCGLTLIELLVVIAIIGVLMAALVPTVTRVRENAYASRCESNLKNLAHAVVNYANDNDGWMPVAGPYEVQHPLTELWHERAAWVNWVNPSGAARGEWATGAGSSQQREPWERDGVENEKAGRMEKPRWWGDKARLSIREGTLWPYLRRDIQTYLCPSFRQRSVIGTSMPVSGDRFDPVRSYVMNDFFYPETQGNGDVRAPWNPRRMQWLEARNNVKPSRLLLFADMSPAIATDTSDGQGWDGVLRPSTDTIGILHGGRAQVVFVDGHVESIRFREFEKQYPAAASWGDLILQLCRGQL